MVLALAVGACFGEAENRSGETKTKYSKELTKALLSNRHPLDTRLEKAREERNKEAGIQVEKWRKELTKNNWTKPTKASASELEKHRDCLQKFENDYIEKWKRPDFKIEAGSLATAELKNGITLGHVLGSNSYVKLPNTLLFFLDLDSCDLLFVEPELVQAELNYATDPSKDAVLVWVHNPHRLTTEYYIDRVAAKIGRYTASRPTILKTGFDIASKCSEGFSSGKLGQDLFEVCDLPKERIWIERAVSSVTILDFEYDSQYSGNDQQPSLNDKRPLEYAPSKFYYYEDHFHTESYDAFEQKLGTNDNIIFRRVRVSN